LFKFSNNARPAPNFDTQQIEVLGEQDRLINLSCFLLGPQNTVNQTLSGYHFKILSKEKLFLLKHPFDIIKQ
jgi:hypothetical protein